MQYWPVAAAKVIFLFSLFLHLSFLVAILHRFPCGALLFYFKSKVFQFFQFFQRLSRWPIACNERVCQVFCRVLLFVFFFFDKYGMTSFTRVDVPHTTRLEFFLLFVMRWMGQKVPHGWTRTRHPALTYAHVSIFFLVDGSLPDFPVCLFRWTSTTSLLSIDDTSR